MTTIAIAYWFGVWSGAALGVVVLVNAAAYWRHQ